MNRAAFIASSAAVAAAASAAAPARAASPVVVLYAGSLVTAMENSVKPAVAKLGLDFQGEAKGSVALASLIASGLRRPDVFISADTKVVDGLMTPEAKNVVKWYVTFAATRLVIGYAPKSPFAADFVAAGRGEKKLADVLLAPGLRIGRTDPALDPKGYRSIIAAKLLERDGAAPAGFAAKLLGDDRNAAQVLPEESLLARLEGGDLDAAFLYATESAARRLPAVELPKTANLGDPAQAAHYALESVTINGIKRVGSPAVYAITIPADAPDEAQAEQFVAYLLGASGAAVLAAAGVTPLRSKVVGDQNAIPKTVADALT